MKVRSGQFVRAQEVVRGLKLEEVEKSHETARCTSNKVDKVSLEE